MHVLSVPVICGLAALSAPAVAKEAAATTADFNVTLRGTTYNPDAGKEVKLQDMSCVGNIQVRGVHVGFDIGCGTLGVYNYTLTGAADAQRMVTTPTVVFSSKVPTLDDSQLNLLSISKLELQDDDFSVLFTTAAGKFKITAKDGAQGGILQMEQEFGAAVEFTHTLGPSLFYFDNTATDKINFGDGTDAVTSGTGAHKMLLGKDSPQAATNTFQGPTSSKWEVTSGGRMGGVLGEDVTEMGAGASACTSDCQAQNRIQGSIPASLDPVSPTPLNGTSAVRRSSVMKKS